MRWTILTTERCTERSVEGRSNVGEELVGPRHICLDKISKAENGQTINVEVAHGVQENERMYYSVKLDVEKTLALIFDVDKRFCGSIHERWKNGDAIDSCS